LTKTAQGAILPNEDDMKKTPSKSNRPKASKRRGKDEKPLELDRGWRSWSSSTTG